MAAKLYQSVLKPQLFSSVSSNILKFLGHLGLQIKSLIYQVYAYEVGTQVVSFFVCAFMFLNM